MFTELISSDQNVHGGGPGLRKADPGSARTPDGLDTCLHGGSVMRVVVALGGNALLRRGQPIALEGQRGDMRLTCDRLVSSNRENELSILA